MKEFATRFAYQLESAAKKIRAQTVNRAERFTLLASIAVTALILIPVILTFLSVALFRVVETLTNNEVAFVIFGGLFLVLGALLWRKKNNPPAK